MKAITRQPEGAPYYFIRLSTLKNCNTLDHHFDSDDEKYETGNYFLSGDQCRHCSAYLSEEYGEELQALASQKLAAKNTAIKAVQTIAKEHLFGEVKPTAKKAELKKVLEGAAKVVDVLKEYTENLADLSKRSQEIRAEIVTIIEKYPKI